MRGIIFVLAACCWTIAGSAASAQDVKWRYDYNSARREAEQKNLPLVVDIGTENCFWCNKLDAITFHDPMVAEAINSKFIPLKVDAHRNAALSDALRIQAFPTVVLAASDGKILATLEGYMEPIRFHEQLQRVLVTVSNPEWMNRDYQEAGKAVTGSDYARAVALLKGVIEDGQNRPVQIKARQLLNEMEQQAAGRLAHAKQLEDKGQTTEAMETLAELVRAYAGTQSAAEGGNLLTKLTDNPEIKARQRTRRARDLLAQAKEDFRTHQYLYALEHCELLVTNYPDLPEGAEAVQLASDIKGNPEWMKKACDSLSDRLGMLYLSLAESWIKKGQNKEAVVCYERVIQSFPGTRQADTAQQRLAQVQGQPTRQANFKK